MTLLIYCNVYTFNVEDISWLTMDKKYKPIVDDCLHTVLCEAKANTLLRRWRTYQGQPNILIYYYVHTYYCYFQRSAVLDTTVQQV